MNRIAFQTRRAADQIYSESIDRAIARSSREGRSNSMFWLACQLRDNGLSQSQAEAAADIFAASVGDRTYSRREAVSTVRSVYRRPPREPWGGQRRQAPRVVYVRTEEDVDHLLAALIAEAAYGGPSKPTLSGPANTARFRQEEFERLMAKAREKAADERALRQQAANLAGELMEGKGLNDEFLRIHALSAESVKQADILVDTATWIQRASNEEVEAYRTGVAR